MKQSKRIAYLFLFILIATNLLSCRRGERFEIPFMAYIEVPAGLNTFLTYHFPVRVGSNGQVPAGLKDAQPARMRLSLETGEPNFNFVRRAFMDAVLVDSSWVEMGYNLDVFMNSSASLDLLPSTYNMVEHISQDSFDIKVKLEFRAIPTATSRIRIDFTVEVVSER